VRIDYRWGASNFDPERMRKGAVELVALAPDVVLATTGPIVLALQQVSRTVPIVFAAAIDPVGAGLVVSLARPHGNATGFTMFEYGISAKWLELLKEISPGVKRVAVLREPTVAGIGQLAAMQTAAPSFGVELQPIYFTFDAPESWFRPKLILGGCDVCSIVDSDRDVDFRQF
jgi:putative ABC transport system substrate-binding protein